MAAAAGAGLIGLWHRAFPALTIIGGVRAGLRSHDVRVTYYDYDEPPNNQRKQRSFLVSERMMAASLGALTYPYLAPMLVWSDISCLEVYLRGLDPKKYMTEKHSMLEVIF